MTQRRLSRRWLVPLCLALLLAGLRPTPPAAVSAATVLHVTDCGDAGANTLRGQLAAAGAGDTIVFDQDCTITLATGTLTLAQDVTIDGSGHTVIVDGGCTAACGTWTAVGGVTVFTVPSGVTAKLNTLTIQHGNTAVNGGGIANSGTLAVTNSTFSGNTADRGGGINNTGTLAVTNSTFSGNDAGGGGGGIANDIVNFVPSTLVVTNSTISGNSAYSGGGGIYNAYVFNGSTLIRDQATVTNTIVAGNTAAATYPDLGATHLNRITSGGHNLFGSVQEDQITLGGGDLVNPTPLLDTLGNNGGPTQTMRLLPGSPAIANGDPTVCANPAGTAPVGGKDQRGAPRPPSLCAIGAFEPLLITISPSSGPITGGTPVTLTGAGFLAGVTVSLGGASCTNVQVATDTTLTCLTGAHAAGVVDVALTIGSVTHTLSHGYFYGDTTLHVTDCGDAGPNTLRGQIAAEARTIVFDQDCTITLTTGTLTLAQNVAIDGSGHTVIVNGGLELAPGVTVFSVPSGVTANLNALTIQNVNTAADGGGIANGGTLAVTNSTIRNNSAATGGGIYNTGTLTVTNSTISGNSAYSSGGGIDNTGTLTVTNSTISGNESINGGGIDNSGALTVTNSTISGNESHYLGGSSGGGINNALGGTATVTNSTISGNSVNSVSGSNGGGIANNSNSTLTLTNSIVAGNSAYANSNVFANGPDIAFAITSGGHNLFGSTSGATFSLGSGDLVNPTPLLGALANNGGPTQTIALLPGSPALDAGGDATCQATGPGQVNGLDQRGSSRTSGAGAHCDIGAFEAYTAPATIALDAASLSQTYDGTPRLVTATTAPAGLAYAVTYGGSPTPPTAAGSYPVVATITAPGESASIAGTLVVAPASQALAFTSTAPTGAVYGGTYTVAATGGASGNPVTFSSLTPEFCTVAGSTVRFTGVGTCTIAANQAGNANHNAASQVTQSVAIAKKALTVTAGDAHRPFGSTAVPCPVTFTGFANADTPAALGGAATCTTTATASSPLGSTHPLTPALGSLTSPNYTFGPFVAGTLMIDKATTALTSVSLNGTYGSTIGTLTAMLTRTLDNSPIAGATVAFTVNGAAACGVSGKPACPTTNAQGVATLGGQAVPRRNAGTHNDYTIIARFVGNPSYEPSSGQGRLVIARAILWLKPTDRTVGLRQPNPPTTPPTNCLAQQTATSACWLELANGSTFANGDDWDDLSLSVLRFQYSRNPAATNATEKVGSVYRITALGATSTNYDLRIQTGTLTVVQAKP